MQKSLQYTVFLLTSLFASTVYCSTQWIFDKGAITRQASDEIDYCLQPGMQNEVLNIDIQFLKNDRVHEIVYKTEIRHRQRPFNNEREAKEYAKQLAHEEAREYYRKIVRNRIAIRLKSFPSPSSDYTQKIKIAAEEKLMSDAASEMSRNRGRLTNALKEVDKNIDINLQQQLSWTREVSRWLTSLR